MEETDRIQIEKYFAHELSEQEKNAMEHRLTIDAAFATEFEAYRQAVEALKLAQREELKNRFRARDKILDSSSNPGTNKTSNIKYIWLLAAALVVMVTGIWILNNNRGPSQESQIALPQDTLRTQEISELPPDSVGEQDKIPMATTEENDKDKWNTQKYDGEELYAANFEPYTDESLDGTVRGDEEDMLPEERFLSGYSGRHYDVAVESFGKMSESFRNNDNLKFIYANALLAEGLTDEAIRVLNEVVASGTPIYSTEASYYLALAHLKKSNEEQTKKQLAKYIAQKDAMQKVKAQKILAKLQ